MRRGADIASGHYYQECTTTDKVRHTQNKECGDQEISNRHQALAVEEKEDESDNIESTNSFLEKSYNDTAKEVRGFKKKSKPCIRQEAWELVDQLRIYV